MSKIYTTGFTAVLLLILFCKPVFAQPGLEKILVEKYYVSDAADSIASGGILPVGSITYRIYADMLPMHKFQAAFGLPGHQLYFATTTAFYNSPYLGNSTSDKIPYSNINEGTLMLDSWLSAGGASSETWGVPKTDDDTIATILNKDNCLQHTHKMAGIPISQRDGHKAGTPHEVIHYGIDSILIALKNVYTFNRFATTNGSWACMQGAMGIDSTTHNRVLIAQLTTNGVLTFELNLQIKTPAHTIVQFVARNPMPNQYQLPSLIYSSAGDGGKKKKKK